MKKLKRMRCLPVMLALAGMTAGLTSCLDDNDEPSSTDYSAWKEANERYVNQQAMATGDDGLPLYSRIIPQWAPSTFTLIRWHNDPSLTADKLSPIDNSTINIKYRCYDMDGNIVSDSYDLKINGDSIYQTTPASMIYGVRAALPMMHEGDSVSLVLPSEAAYGARGQSDVKPYSALRFDIKLKKVVHLEVN